MMAEPPLRIIAVSETWQGANSYAFLRAFRRAGHSVSVIADEWYAASGWRSRPMRALRRALTPLIVREMTREIERQAEEFRPHLLFVFKGTMVTPDAIRAIQAAGGVAICFWPDVSTTTHGPRVARALPAYDWIFTTKTFGLADMESAHGVSRASVLAHGYDCETHRPVALAADDLARYACDVSFIGTWSPKKEKLLAGLLAALPGLDLRIWGAQWERAEGRLGAAVQHRNVLGLEYAKAIIASKINLALLSEVRSGASSGDQITSRSFHIPASGGFMLHERTEEIAQCFSEDEDCAMFGDGDELCRKVALFLEDEPARIRIGRAGHARATQSGYSIDDRAAAVVAKARTLLEPSQATVSPSAATTFQATPSEQASVGPSDASVT